MDPKNYTEEMLNRRFTMVLASGGDSLSNPDEITYYRSSKEMLWGVPKIFTLREARDGFPPMHKEWNRGVTLSKTSCEKLRRLKVGKRARMCNDSQLSNCWFALRLDPEAEDTAESKVHAKEAELREVQAKIKAAAGDLMKAERKLRKELNALRAEWYKG